MTNDDGRTTTDGRHVHGRRPPTYDDYRVVWKFGALFRGDNDIDMPEGARLLHFDWQRRGGHNNETERAFVWALVDPTARLVTRRLTVVGTGESMTRPGIYVGTLVDPDALHIWHLFDKGMV